MTNQKIGRQVSAQIQQRIETAVSDRDRIALAVYIGLIYNPEHNFEILRGQPDDFKPLL